MFGIKPKCPLCDSRKQVVPIVYGLPSAKAMADSTDKNGNLKFVFGGCEVGTAKYYCSKCKVNF